MLNKFATLTQKLSPGLRQIMANTAWLFSEKILQLSVGLLVGVWVARYLGPEKFGLFNYAMTFVALFAPLSNLGLDTIVVRDIARDPACKAETLGTAFTLKLMGGIVTLSLAVGTISLLNPSEKLLPWLTGVVAIGTIFQAFDTIDLWFRSQIQSKYTIFAKNSAYIFIALVRVALIQTRAPLIAFAWARAAEIALGAVALVIVYRNNGHHIQAWRSSIKRAKSLLQQSWPLLVAGFTTFIYSKIDQVMLGTLLTDKAELGFYSVAVKLSELFDFIPMMLSVSFLPKLAEIKRRSEADYQKSFQIYFDIMFFLWLVVAIPVSLLSSHIVNFMYGPYYANSASILSIYVWAQFGSNFGVARSAFLVIEGKQKFSLYISVIGALINITINLFLIPTAGAVGATIATLITYFMVTVLINFLVTDLRPIALYIFRSFNLYKSALRLLSLGR
ncbi:flippase [Argonema galeatum]|uniref:flippase n=1 Tax=Argonema galeatum TaxID=2942762 RepID=UPI002010DB25|nr:flippase [Argonema galeatum]MCL1467690.1 flippase [Argonema galeatum A003/A1]